MAKVNIEYDNETRQLSVSVNDSVIENVARVVIEKYGDEDMNCFIESVSKDEENRLVTIQQMVAQDGSLIDNSLVRNEVIEFLGK